MTKLDKIRDAMLCIIVDCVNEQEHDSEKVIAKVDELLQAVRDEEFLLHRIKVRCSRAGSAIPCDKCKAKGTRYCP